MQYLAFRLHDLRELQVMLSDLGLSSMGRAERKVQATTDTILTHPHNLSGPKWQPEEKPIFCYKESRRLLDENTHKLLGEQLQIRVRITLIRPGGKTLRGEKGINLPESKLRLPAMSGDDRNRSPEHI